MIYSTKYYDVIITTAVVVGDEEAVEVYGIKNKQTGVVEEKVKNLPTALEVADELTKFLQEFYSTQIKEVKSVSAINLHNKTV